MKALRYLLMVVAMVSVLGVYAQSTAKLPEPMMQSTSTMVTTGTTLPFAAAEGTYVTGSTPGTYSPAGRPGNIRKIGGSGSGTGGNEAEESKDPFETPIGDAVWPLLALAAAFAFGKWIARTKPLR